MTAIDDQLILSETQATKAAEMLADLRGTEAVVSAALAQRDAIHALTLTGQVIAVALTKIADSLARPAVDSDKLADVMREAQERYSLGDYDGRWPFIARQTLEFLGIEDCA